MNLYISNKLFDFTFLIPKLPQKGLFPDLFLPFSPIVAIRILILSPFFFGKTDVKYQLIIRRVI